MGWRPPPPRPAAAVPARDKDRDGEAPPKRPAQAQAEFANRLSQGLSTCNISSIRQHMFIQNNLNAGSSITLNGEEGAGGVDGGGSVSELGGGAANNSNIRQRRNNRSRLSAPNAAPAALRQQIYYFDPNYM